MLRLSRLAFAVVSLSLVAAGCDRVTATEPAPAPAAPRALLGLIDLPPLGIGGLQLLGCPSTVTRTASADVGPNGGTLAVGGFRVDFPAGAVDSVRTFTLTVPASDVLEIEVHAEGFAHYTFATPVTVTLDASRCGLLPLGLQVYHIDTQTRALLEPMGGVVDLLSRKVRFRTPHFSGYSIAW